MVLVLDPLQEKVSCPRTGRSELDPASSDVIPQYWTHSNSRACAPEQVDERHGGSSSSPDSEADALKIVEPHSSASNGEDGPNGAVNSIQRRRAIKKPPEDGVQKLKVMW